LQQCKTIQKGLQSVSLLLTVFVHMRVYSNPPFASALHDCLSPL
jgi:hypothetical protein